MGQPQARLRRSYPGRLHFDLAASEHQDDSPRVSDAAFDNVGEIDSDLAKQPSEMHDLEGRFKQIEAVPKIPVVGSQSRATSENPTAVWLHRI